MDLGKKLKTIKRSGLLYWFISFLFLIIITPFVIVSLIMNSSKDPGNVKIGGNTTFDTSSIYSIKDKVSTVGIKGFSLNTTYKNINYILILSFLFIIILFFILALKTKRVKYEIYEHGIKVIEKNTEKESLYEDITYSMVKYHKVVIMILGLKININDSWIIIPGDLAHEIVKLYEDLRMEKSLLEFKNNKMVSFLVGKVGFFQDTFRISFDSLFPRKFCNILIGMENLEIGGVTYKNSNLEFNLSEERIIINESGKTIFKEEFYNISNPDIFYTLITEIKSL